MHLAGLQWSAVPSVANTNPTQNVSTFVAAVPKGLSFLELFNDSTGTFSLEGKSAKFGTFFWRRSAAAFTRDLDGDLS